MMIILLLVITGLLAAGLFSGVLLYMSWLDKEEKKRSSVSATTFTSTKPKRHCPDPAVLDVLVVADKPMIQTLLYDGLKYLGVHSIDVADNGPEALERFANETYKLVLVDCHTQNDGGFEIIRSMHNLKPNVPVIGVSSLTEEAAREKCGNGDMNGYLQKPLNFYAMEESIRKIFDMPVRKKISPSSERPRRQDMHNNGISVIRNGTF